MMMVSVGRGCSGFRNRNLRVLYPKYNVFHCDGLFQSVGFLVCVGVPLGATSTPVQQHEIFESDLRLNSRSIHAFQES